MTDGPELPAPSRPDAPSPLRAAAERNARLFDMLAESYDGVGVDFFGPIATDLLEALAPAPGERVADLGCGKGALLLPAARAVGPTGRVVGLDVSPAMARAASAAAAAAGLDHVEVAVDDAQAPHLPAGAFDVVASSLVLFFLADPLGALRSWYRLLAPGGRLGVSTFGPVDDVWRSVDDVFTPYLPPAMLDARTSGAAGPFESDEGMAALLVEAGFVGVTTRTLDLPVRFADADQWEAFTWSTGQRAMWLAVPEDERDSVRAEARRRLARATDSTERIVLHQRVRATLGRRPA